MFFILAFVLSTANAGRGLSPEQNKKYTKECNKEISGRACVELANETLCGMGYNPTYAKFMKKACNVFRKNCEKGKAAACTEHAYCLLDCSTLDEDSYVSTTMDALGMRHCFFTTKEENTAAGIKRLSDACLGGDVKGCLSAAMIFEHAEEPDDVKRQSMLRQACSLDDAKGCATLSEILKKEATETQEKACRLGAKEHCIPPSK